MAKRFFWLRRPKVLEFLLEILSVTHLYYVIRRTPFEGARSLSLSLGATVVASSVLEFCALSCNPFEASTSFLYAQEFVRRIFLSRGQQTFRSVVSEEPPDLHGFSQGILAVPIVLLALTVHSASREAKQARNHGALLDSKTPWLARLTAVSLLVAWTQAPLIFTALASSKSAAASPSADRTSPLGGGGSEVNQAQLPNNADLNDDCRGHLRNPPHPSATGHPSLAASLSRGEGGGETPSLSDERGQQEPKERNSGRRPGGGGGNRTTILTTTTSTGAAAEAVIATTTKAATTGSCGKQNTCPSALRGSFWDALLSGKAAPPTMTATMMTGACLVAFLGIMVALIVVIFFIPRDPLRGFWVAGSLHRDDDGVGGGVRMSLVSWVSALPSLLSGGAAVVLVIVGTLALHWAIFQKLPGTFSAGEVCVVIQALVVLGLVTATAYQNLPSDRMLFSVAGDSRCPSGGEGWSGCLSSALPFYFGAARHVASPGRGCGSHPPCRAIPLTETQAFVAKVLFWSATLSASVRLLLEALLTLTDKQAASRPADHLSRHRISFPCGMESHSQRVVPRAHAQDPLLSSETLVSPEIRYVPNGDTVAPGRHGNEGSGGACDGGQVDGGRDGQNEGRSKEERKRKRQGGGRVKQLVKHLATAALWFAVAALSISALVGLARWVVADFLLPPHGEGAPWHDHPQQPPTAFEGSWSKSEGSGSRSGFSGGTTASELLPCGSRRNGSSTSSDHPNPSPSDHRLLSASIRRFRRRLPEGLGAAFNSFFCSSSLTELLAARVCFAGVPEYQRLFGVGLRRPLILVYWMALMGFSLPLMVWIRPTGGSRPDKGGEEKDPRVQHAPLIYDSCVCESEQTAKRRRGPTVASGRLSVFTGDVARCKPFARCSFAPLLHPHYGSASLSEIPLPTSKVPSRSPSKRVPPESLGGRLRDGLGDGALSVFLGESAGSERRDGSRGVEVAHSSAPEILRDCRNSSVLVTSQLSASLSLSTHSNNDKGDRGVRSIGNLSSGDGDGESVSVSGGINGASNVSATTLGSAAETAEGGGGGEDAASAAGASGGVHSYSSLVESARGAKGTLQWEWRRAVAKYFPCSYPSPSLEIPTRVGEEGRGGGDNAGGPGPGLPLILVRKGYHLLAMALFAPIFFVDLEMLQVSLAIASALLVALEGLRCCCGRLAAAFASECRSESQSICVSSPSASASALQLLALVDGSKQASGSKESATDLDGREKRTNTKKTETLANPLNVEKRGKKEKEGRRGKGGTASPAWGNGNPSSSRSSILNIDPGSWIRWAAAIHWTLDDFMRRFTDDRDAGPVYVTHLTLLLGIAVPIWVVSGSRSRRGALGSSFFSGLNKSGNGGSGGGSSGVPSAPGEGAWFSFSGGEFSSGIFCRSSELDPDLLHLVLVGLSGLVALGAGDTASACVGRLYGRVKLFQKVLPVAPTPEPGPAASSASVSKRGVEPKEHADEATPPSRVRYTNCKTLEGTVAGVIAMLVTWAFLLLALQSQQRATHCGAVSGRGYKLLPSSDSGAAFCGGAVPSLAAATPGEIPRFPLDVSQSLSWGLSLRRLRPTSRFVEFLAVTLAVGLLEASTAQLDNLVVPPYYLAHLLLFGAH